MSEIITPQYSGLIPALDGKFSAAERIAYKPNKVIEAILGNDLAQQQIQNNPRNTADPTNPKDKNIRKDIVDVIKDHIIGKFEKNEKLTALEVHILLIALIKKNNFSDPDTLRFTQELLVANKAILGDIDISKIGLNKIRKELIILLDKNALNAWTELREIFDEINQDRTIDKVQGSLLKYLAGRTDIRLISRLEAFVGDFNQASFKVTDRKGIERIFKDTFIARQLEGITFSRAEIEDIINDAENKKPSSITLKFAVWNFAGNKNISDLDVMREWAESLGPGATGSVDSKAEVKDSKDVSQQKDFAAEVDGDVGKVTTYNQAIDIANNSPIALIKIAMFKERGDKISFYNDPYTDLRDEGKAISPTFTREDIEMIADTFCISKNEALKKYYEEVDALVDRIIKDEQIDPSKAQEKNTKKEENAKKVAEHLHKLQNNIFKEILSAVDYKKLTDSYRKENFGVEALYNNCLLNSENAAKIKQKISERIKFSKDEEEKARLTKIIKDIEKYESIYNQLDNFKHTYIKASRENGNDKKKYHFTSIEAAALKDFVKDKDKPITYADLEEAAKADNVGAQALLRYYNISCRGLTPEGLMGQSEFAYYSPVPTDLQLRAMLEKYYKEKGLSANYDKALTDFFVSVPKNIIGKYDELRLKSPYNRYPDLFPEIKTIEKLSEMMDNLVETFQLLKAKENCSSEEEILKAKTISNFFENPGLDTIINSTNEWMGNTTEAFKQEMDKRTTGLYITKDFIIWLQNQPTTVKYKIKNKSINSNFFEQENGLSDNYRNGYFNLMGLSSLETVPEYDTQKSRQNGIQFKDNINSFIESHINQLTLSDSSLLSDLKQKWANLLTMGSRFDSPYNEVKGHTRELVTNSGNQAFMVTGGNFLSCYVRNQGTLKKMLDCLSEFFKLGSVKKQYPELYREYEKLRNDFTSGKKYKEIDEDARNFIWKIETTPENVAVKKELYKEFEIDYQDQITLYEIELVQQELKEKYENYIETVVMKDECSDINKQLEKKFSSQKSEELHKLQEKLQNYLNYENINSIIEIVSKRKENEQLEKLKIYQEAFNDVQKTLENNKIGYLSLFQGMPLKNIRDILFEEQQKQTYAIGSDGDVSQTFWPDFPLKGGFFDAFAELMQNETIDDIAAAALGIIESGEELLREAGFDEFNVPEKYKMFFDKTIRLSLAVPTAAILFTKALVTEHIFTAFRLLVEMSAAIFVGGPVFIAKQPVDVLRGNVKLSEAAGKIFEKVWNMVLFMTCAPVWYTEARNRWNTAKTLDDYLLAIAIFEVTNYLTVRMGVWGRTATLDNLLMGVIHKIPGAAETFQEMHAVHEKYKDDPEYKQQIESRRKRILNMVVYYAEEYSSVRGGALKTVAKEQAIEFEKQHPDLAATLKKSYGVAGWMLNPVGNGLSALSDTSPITKANEWLHRKLLGAGQVFRMPWDATAKFRDIYTYFTRKSAVEEKIKKIDPDRTPEAIDFAARSHIDIGESLGGVKGVIDSLKKVDIRSPIERKETGKRFTFHFPLEHNDPAGFKGKLPLTSTGAWRSSIILKDPGNLLNSTNWTWGEYGDVYGEARLYDYLNEHKGIIPTEFKGINIDGEKRDVKLKEIILTSEGETQLLLHKTGEGDPLATLIINEKEFDPKNFNSNKFENKITDLAKKEYVLTDKILETKDTKKNNSKVNNKENNKENQIPISGSDGMYDDEVNKIFADANKNIIEKYFDAKGKLMNEAEFNKAFKEAQDKLIEDLRGINVNEGDIDTKINEKLNEFRPWLLASIYADTGVRLYPHQLKALMAYGEITKNTYLQIGTGEGKTIIGTLALAERALLVRAGNFSKHLGWTTNWLTSNEDLVKQFFDEKQNDALKTVRNRMGIALGQISGNVDNSAVYKSAEVFIGAGQLITDTGSGQHQLLGKDQIRDLEDLFAKRDYKTLQEKIQKYKDKGIILPGNIQFDEIDALTVLQARINIIISGSNGADRIYKQWFLGRSYRKEWEKTHQIYKKMMSNENYWSESKTGFDEYQKITLTDAGRDAFLEEYNKKFGTEYTKFSQIDPKFFEQIELFKNAGEIAYMLINQETNTAVAKQYNITIEDGKILHISAEGQGQKTMVFGGGLDEALILTLNDIKDNPSFYKSRLTGGPAGVAKFFKDHGVEKMLFPSEKSKTFANVNLFTYLAYHNMRISGMSGSIALMNDIFSGIYNDPEFLKKYGFEKLSSRMIKIEPSIKDIGLAVRTNNKGEKYLQLVDKEDNPLTDKKYDLNKPADRKALVEYTEKQLRDAHKAGLLKPGSTYCKLFFKGDTASLGDGYAKLMEEMENMHQALKTDPKLENLNADSSLLAVKNAKNPTVTLDEETKTFQMAKNAIENAYTNVKVTDDGKVEFTGEPKPRQTVLVTVDDIRFADKVYKKISEMLKDTKVANKIVNATAEDDAEFGKKLGKAREKGTITVNTRFQRGIDHYMDKFMDELGGMIKQGNCHVVAGSLNIFEALEIQIVGRSARAGLPGSWEVIISLDEINITDKIDRDTLKQIKQDLGLIDEKGNIKEEKITIPFGSEEYEKLEAFKQKVRAEHSKALVKDINKINDESYVDRQVTEKYVECFNKQKDGLKELLPSLMEYKVSEYLNKISPAGLTAESLEKLKEMINTEYGFKLDFDSKELASLSREKAAELLGSKISDLVVTRVGADLNDAVKMQTYLTKTGEIFRKYNAIYLELAEKTRKDFNSASAASGQSAEDIAALKKSFLDNAFARTFSGLSDEIIKMYAPIRAIVNSPYYKYWYLPYRLDDSRKTVTITEKDITDAKKDEKISTDNEKKVKADRKILESYIKNPDKVAAAVKKAETKDPNFVKLIEEIKQYGGKYTVGEPFIAADGKVKVAINIETPNGFAVSKKEGLLSSKYEDKFYLELTNNKGLISAKYALYEGGGGIVKTKQAAIQDITDTVTVKNYEELEKITSDRLNEAGILEKLNDVQKKEIKEAVIETIIKNNNISKDKLTNNQAQKVMIPNTKAFQEIFGIVAEDLDMIKKSEKPVVEFAKRLKKIDDFDIKNNYKTYRGDFKPTDHTGGFLLGFTMSITRQIGNMILNEKDKDKDSADIILNTLHGAWEEGSRTAYYGLKDELAKYIWDVKTKNVYIKGYLKTQSPKAFFNYYFKGTTIAPLALMGAIDGFEGSFRQYEHLLNSKDPYQQDAFIKLQKRYIRKEAFANMLYEAGNWLVGQYTKCAPAKISGGLFTVMAANKALDKLIIDPYYKELIAEADLKRRNVDYAELMGCQGDQAINAYIKELQEDKVSYGKKLGEISVIRDRYMQYITEFRQIKQPTYTTTPDDFIAGLIFDEQKFAEFKAFLIQKHQQDSTVNNLTIFQLNSLVTTNDDVISKLLEDDNYKFFADLDIKYQRLLSQEEVNEQLTYSQQIQQTFGIAITGVSKAFIYGTAKVAIEKTAGFLSKPVVISAAEKAAGIVAKPAARAIISAEKFLLKRMINQSPNITRMLFTQIARQAANQTAKKAGTSVAVRAAGTKIPLLPLQVVLAASLAGDVNALVYDNKNPKNDPIEGNTTWFADDLFKVDFQNGPNKNAMLIAQQLANMGAFEDKTVKAEIAKIYKLQFKRDDFEQVYKKVVDAIKSGDRDVLRDDSLFWEFFYKLYPGSDRDSVLPYFKGEKGHLFECFMDAGYAWYSRELAKRNLDQRSQYSLYSVVTDPSGKQEGSRRDNVSVNLNKQFMLTLDRSALEKANATEQGKKSLIEKRDKYYYDRKREITNLMTANYYEFLRQKNKISAKGYEQAKATLNKWDKAHRAWQNKEAPGIPGSIYAGTYDGKPFQLIESLYNIPEEHFHEFKKFLRGKIQEKEQKTEREQNKYLESMSNQQNYFGMPYNQQYPYGSFPIQFMPISNDNAVGQKSLFSKGELEKIIFTIEKPSISEDSLKTMNTKVAPELIMRAKYKYWQTPVNSEKVKVPEKYRNNVFEFVCAEIIDLDSLDKLHKDNLQLFYSEFIAANSNIIEFLDAGDGKTYIPTLKNGKNEIYIPKRFLGKETNQTYENVNNPIKALPKDIYKISSALVEAIIDDAIPKEIDVIFRPKPKLKK